MEKKYIDIVLAIESLSSEIKGKHGISIDPLDEAIAQLKKHTENITKIEDNIEAIQEEVIENIRIELEKGKKASKYSTWGFFVGFLGLFTSIVAIIFQMWSAGNFHLFRTKTKVVYVQPELYNYPVVFSNYLKIKYPIKAADTSQVFLIEGNTEFSVGLKYHNSIVFGINDRYSSFVNWNEYFPDIEKNVRDSSFSYENYEPPRYFNGDTVNILNKHFFLVTEDKNGDFYLSNLIESK